MSADIFATAESDFSPPPGACCLKVTERTRATFADVHPGWIRATSILLKGMERLRSQEQEAGGQRLTENSALHLGSPVLTVQP